MINATDIIDIIIDHMDILRSKDDIGSITAYYELFDIIFEITAKMVDGDKNEY